jgi:hypothetical protein
MIIPRFPFFAILMLLTFLTPRFSHASVIFTAQNRKVEAEPSASDAGLVDQPGRLTIPAIDFGPFTTTAFQTATAGTASSSAFSQQDSQLNPALIKDLGSLAITASAGPINGNTGAATSAYNLFQVFFTLDEPTPYTLITAMAGNLSGDGLGRNDGHIRLTGTSGTVLDRLFPDSGEQTIEGVLPPDAYQLLGEFTLGATLFPSPTNSTSLAGNMDYSIRLSLPEPATLPLLGFAGLAVLCKRAKRRANAT